MSFPLFLLAQCNVCKQQFMCTLSAKVLKEHSDAKHPKSTFAECFPGKEIPT